MNDPSSATSSEAPAAQARTAVIVAVPEAEPVVGELRSLHAPEGQADFPAHITLFVPFVEPEHLDRRVHERLTEVARGCAPFEFELASVGRFPETSYLVPAPAEPFIALTRALAVAFPPLLPYGGAFDAIVPHLTIADRVSEDVIESVESAVAPRTPLRCRAERMQLLVKEADGLWRTRREFRLGAAGVHPAR